jgi:type IV secretion system protein VirD4
MAKTDMTGFADRNGLARHGVGPGAFMLGRFHPDHGINTPAGIKDDRHLFIMAGSRAGKGTTMIMPNLIDWPGGLLCIDPKGEAASITAMRRGTKDAASGTGTRVQSFLGQDVAILDPFRTVRGPARRFRVPYDPLIDVEVGSDEESGQILAIAESIVMAEQGTGAHFSESAETILAGMIEAVVHKEAGLPSCSLATCRAKAIEGHSALRKYLIATPETPAALAENAVMLMDGVGEEEGGSFLSTLSRQLKWLAEPRLQKHLRPGAFSLKKAMRENSTVYVCIPPSKIPGMKRWLRLLVRVALDAKMSSPFAHEGPQTLFLLDEFFALGHMQLIEDAAAYMAGYGIKLLPVIQNIGQVKKLYEKNWETFLGNAGGIIAWGLNDLDTEKYLSDRIGPVLVWETSISDGQSMNPDNFGAANVSHSRNLALRERPIRWASEIHTQGARPEMRAFVIPADGLPFTVQRVEYMAREGEGVFDSPASIRAWEDKLPPETREQLDAL